MIVVMSLGNLGAALSGGAVLGYLLTARYSPDVPATIA
jgi:hypothetical protein